MSKIPGFLGGQQSGNPEIAALRSRRQAQMDSMNSGGSLGAGLKIDRKGRLAIKTITALDPYDPNFAVYLVQQLQAIGLMEK